MKLMMDVRANPNFSSQREESSTNASPVQQQSWVGQGEWRGATSQFSVVDPQTEVEMGM